MNTLKAKLRKLHQDDRVLGKMQVLQKEITDIIYGQVRQDDNNIARLCEKVEFLETKNIELKAKNAVLATLAKNGCTCEIKRQIAENPANPDLVTWMLSGTLIECDTCTTLRKLGYDKVQAMDGGA